MKKTIFSIIMIISILAISMINISAVALTDPNNVIPDTYPIGNLTITSGFSPFQDIYTIIYNGANISTSTNENVVTEGFPYGTSNMSTEQEGVYNTYIKAGSAQLNKKGSTVTFTISNVLWSKGFDYLPEIYIPQSMGDGCDYLWYTNDPVAYVTYKVRSVSTGVVFTESNIQLQDIMTNITPDRYYKMSDAFRDSAFPVDMRDVTYYNDLIIESLSITLFKNTDQTASISTVKFRYKTFKSYLDTNGEMKNPLQDYYNYFLRKTDTSSYDEGYNDGYDKGQFEGDRAGFKRGYDLGKRAGYQEGYDQGATKGFDFTSWVGNTLSDIMDVQFGFISLGTVVGVVVSILLLRWILKIVGG